jgi:hypothetical protein
MFTQAFWDTRYSSRSKLWSGQPNPRLVDHASELAGGTALDIDWRHEDLLTWDGPEPGSYDLVSSQFMHLPEEPRGALFHRSVVTVALL